MEVSDIVKEYQRWLEVSTILCARDIPILHVVQSGNLYLVLTAKNIIHVISKYDETLFPVCLHSVETEVLT